MKTLDTGELRALLDAGPVAIFDVRGDTKYERGHIPDAKTAPLGSLVFRVARVMNSDSLVVVYSEARDCPLAEEASKRLENLGLTNVRVYKDGILGWQKAGNPVVASVKAKVHTHGEFRDCRSVIVDTETAYGGAFQDSQSGVEGAGG